MKMAAGGSVIAAIVCTMLALSSALPGGWEAADKSSKQVKEMAAFSVSQYNMQSNDDYIAKMISLRGAKQQVVAGMNYKLTIVLGNTACKKSENNINKPCPLQKGSELKKIRCVFRVYDIPWENKRTLEGKQCTNI
ncbi:cystatin 10-like [Mantella aurantiaca]